MKKKASREPATSKRQRELTRLQVQEYVDRYYPEMGEVSVHVSPSGTSISVYKKPIS